MPATIEGERKLAAGPETVVRANTFPLAQVVAMTDLSPAATNAVWRAGLVARDHGAAMRILHVGTSKARVLAAQRALEALAWELQERLNITVQAQAVRGAVRRTLLAATREADLLVVRTSQSRPLRDWVTGVHPERWLDACPIPALVVRRPASVSYQRILVSAHDGATATASIAVGTAMARGPYQDVLRSLAADAEFGDAWRKRGGQLRGDRHRAALRLRGLVQDLMEKGDAPRVGDAPAIVLDGAAPALLGKERSMFADLMVFARHAYRQPPLGVLRTNTREVLAGARADVLVLPAHADGHVATA